jgi:hypothetical protein
VEKVDSELVDEWRSCVVSDLECVIADGEDAAVEVTETSGGADWRDLAVTPSGSRQTRRLVARL